MTNNEYRGIVAHHVCWREARKRLERTFLPRTPLEQFLTGEMATSFGHWHDRYHKPLRSNVRLFFEVCKQLAGNPSNGTPKSC